MRKDFFSIADGSAPFFLESDRDTHNWSKAPLSHLEKRSLPSKKKHKRIRESFSTYTKRISNIGFNSVSLDELCYLAIYPFYGEEEKKKIKAYRKKYRKLFRIAESRNLNLFLTSDFFSVNDSIWKATEGKWEKIAELFRYALEDIFSEFPEVSGIILRIGESDGVDVKGDFRSKLLLQKPSQANALLKRVLPVFEKYERKLIFRTWTLGAYRIGDLIWNPETYDRVFHGIKSDSLIVSMKYGEADFFRYLELNPLFFHDNRPKILELQARREYEGFGEYPSFVGWQYQKYRDLLYRKKANLVGISVWAQTGGWSSFRNITFLKKSSYWNELNAFVSVRMFRDPGRHVEDCVKDFYGKKNLEEFLLFLKYSEKTVENILYDPEFAKQTLYVHRVRIPPILHATWDKITVSDPFRLLSSAFNRNRKKSLQAAESAFLLIKEMRRIGKKLDLPYDPSFHQDSFQIFLNCRKLLLQHNQNLFAETKKLVKRYHRKYPNTFHFQLRAPQGRPSLFARLALRILVRKRSRPRFLDRILFHPFLLKIYYLVFLSIRNRLPDFLNRQGMPVRELLS